MKEILNIYFEKGLLYKQTHPVLPLTIWNYTPKTQYESMWDEITLTCRGLVTDEDGNVVARPFRKFFNIEEGKHKPTENFEVFEKMDGSLGILFFYQNQWVFSSRGSFTSDQSVKGIELLQKYDYKKLQKNYTYLFEIIYPENRIVCEYDFEDLILLGIIETKSGIEVNLYDDGEDIKFKNLIKNIGFRLVKRFDKIKSYQFLKQSIPNDKEGFVIKFSNGDRIKIKGEEYIRIHKLISNFSNTSVWEVLSSGGKIENFLEDVPDEFYKKIKEYEKELKYNFYQISEYCGKAHDTFRYGKFNDRDLVPTKKEFAEYVMTNYSQFSSVLFAMWDKKPYEHIIWNMIKPKFEKL